MIILAVLVAYGEWVNLAIVSALPLVLWTSLLYWQQYSVSPSSDKCTYCRSLWIKPSAKWPKCKCYYRSVSILTIPGMRFFPWYFSSTFPCPLEGWRWGGCPITCPVKPLESVTMIKGWTNRFNWTLARFELFFPLKLQRGWYRGQAESIHD